jgi:CheY-like chemotaxis protein
VHLLHRGPVAPADLERGIETIERNARLQARLVDDLLDMNRIASGKLRLELQPVSLPAVIEAALETATPAAEARRIRVQRRIEAVPPLHGDPARLQQVMWNLISNAIKVTPPGGEVTVALRNLGSDVEIAVSDTGIGIAADALERVFERFRQADASSTREHGGLGLGLTIARQLAEMHGGSLTAPSEGTDRGATFTLRLPVPAGVSSPLPAVTPLERPALAPLGNPSLEGVRVLVVEDQSDARELIERILREQHADVRSAEGVGQALELYARDRFDVVVSDLAMPGRDGYELMKELRARGETVPAIALSAFARSQDAERVRAAGYQVHLKKPVQPAELAGAVALLAARPAGNGRR